jgi:hypothetical protein
VIPVTQPMKPYELATSVALKEGWEILAILLLSV